MANEPLALRPEVVTYPQACCGRALWDDGEVSKTLHLQAGNPDDLATAARLVQQGGLVAFPTETVYGLGANALSPEAVAGIFRAKGRPAWDPLIVHLPDISRLSDVAVVSNEPAPRVQALAAAFWPGPLTLLLPRTVAVSDAVTAGRPLVGVRVPAHPVAQALLRATGLPLAAPSANRFGHVSPTTAEHVLADLDGRIDAVLDAGSCAVGVESTVLDPGPTPMILYRSGAVAPEALEQACGIPVTVFQPNRLEAQPEALPSPGVGIRHYAPEAQVILSAGTPDALWAAVARAESQTERVGVLLPGDWARSGASAAEVQRWGVWADAATLAAELFAGLRALEQQAVAAIVCPLPEPGGLRDAVRDRLIKAAKPR